MFQWLKDQFKKDEKKPLKLILLDRDGVINHDSDEYIKSPGEWQPIPGSLDAIAKLTQNGYTIAVVTNQSGLARKLFDENTLAEIHDKMQAMVIKHGGKIDKIVYCPHHPDDNCECRKPKIDLLKQLQQHYQHSLQDVYFVGDSLKDLQAAEQVGAIGILVLTGKGNKTFSELKEKNIQVPVFRNLETAVNAIIKNNVVSFEHA